MRYIIDAYNLAHAIGIIPSRRTAREGALEQAREQLIQKIRTAHADAKSGDVVIVFDAKKAPTRSDSEERRGPILIQYTYRQDADNWIIDFVEHHPAPRSLMVVTNDTHVQNEVRRRKARFWNCSEYLDWIESEPERQRAARPELEKPSQGTDDDWAFREFGDLDSDPKMRKLFGPDFEDRSKDDR